VRLQKRLQVLLGAARFRQDDRLASGPDAGQPLEAQLQGLEQRSRLGIDADAVRPFRKPLENVDLLPQFLPVDDWRRRGLLTFRVFILGKYFVE
jgi:hypothetical protein